MRHVFIPLDGSAVAEQVLEPAVALGQLSGADNTLLQIVKPVLFVGHDPTVLGDPALGQPATEQLQAEARTYLEGVADRLRAQALRVQTRVIVNTQPAVAILEQSLDCIAFAKSGPDLIKPEWVKSMARSAIVFACSNPLPEIWPWDARQAGARVVGTGRGDFPNQINNSLGVPAIFRGTLDVGAHTITEGMALAAAGELARFAEARGIREDDIIPRMDEWEVFPREAVATALKAQEQGIARLSKTQEQHYDHATKVIRDAREATQLLMKERYIPQAP